MLPKITTLKVPEGVLKIPYIFLGLLVFLILLVLFLKLPQSPFLINSSSPAVVEKLQALNRLETSSFTIEKIIDAGTSGGAFKNFLFGDRLLLIAHGQVIAGFDLAKLTKNDVSVRDKSVTITLPVPQILVSKLDNNLTRVYDRQQGLLTHGNKDLETQARETAEKSIRQAACDEGILSEATKNGKNELTVLLKSFGFTSITITAPLGNCQ